MTDGNTKDMLDDVKLLKRSLGLTTKEAYEFLKLSEYGRVIERVSSEYPSVSLKELYLELKNFYYEAAFSRYGFGVSDPKGVLNLLYDYLNNHADRAVRLGSEPDIEAVRREGAYEISTRISQEDLTKAAGIARNNGVSLYYVLRQFAICKYDPMLRDRFVAGLVEDLEEFNMENIGKKMHQILVKYATMNENKFRRLKREGVYYRLENQRILLFDYIQSNPMHMHMSYDQLVNATRTILEEAKKSIGQNIVESKGLFEIDQILPLDKGSIITEETVEFVQYILHALLENKSWVNKLS